MFVVNSSLDLSVSVSSILSRKEPLFFLAYSQLNRAVRAVPICKLPVGLGASLTLTFTFFVNLDTGPTGFEPATSAVTGRCSNRLNYGPKFLRTFKKFLGGSQMP